jgi:hypothetical protein
MLDALFWYTGLVVWILILFALVSALLIVAHDRSVLNRQAWCGARRQKLRSSSNASHSRSSDERPA